MIAEYLRSELVAGRMFSPIPPSLANGVHCSPVGLVPKGRDSGRWQMIVDLSYPEGQSVNDGIPTTLCSL